MISDPCWRERYEVLERETVRLRAACDATLLFHGGIWDNVIRGRFENLIVQAHAGDQPLAFEGTTKCLCDAIRAARQPDTSHG